MSFFFNKIISAKVLRFLIVGGASTAMDFILYMLLSIRIPLTYAKAISMSVSSIFSYVVNKNYTFKKKKSKNISYLFRFYGAYMINLGINLSVNHLTYHIMENKVCSFIVATICGMAANFLLQNFYVFSKNHIETV